MGCYRLARATLVDESNISRSEFQPQVPQSAIREVKVDVASDQVGPNNRVPSHVVSLLVCERRGILSMGWPQHFTTSTQLDI